MRTFIIFTLLFSIGIMKSQNSTRPKPAHFPAVYLKKPQTFALANGLKVLIVEDLKLPRVSFNLSLDNKPFLEADKKGVIELTGNLLGNGSINIPKADFNDEIDFLGADFYFGLNSSTAQGLSKYNKRILELLADGVLNPIFIQEEFDKEKAKLSEGLKAQEKSASAIANRVSRALAFGKEHPSGEFMTEQTLKNITLADVEAVYKDYFMPENAYLVIVGDIQLATIKADVEKLFGKWKKGAAPKKAFAIPTNPTTTEIDLVDVPNAVQSEIALVNTVQLKMGDPDYFPAAVANQILGGDFNGYLNMNLREKNGWTYGAGSGVAVNKYSTLFYAKSAVRNAVTAGAVMEFIHEIKRIRTEKVDSKTLETVKAGYIGKFVMAVEKPQTIAKYALNIQTEKLPADFYDKYIQNIEKVTAEDVMRVANKYFLIDNIRIVIAGKKDDVLPELNKLNIPILFFNKYGNPMNDL